MQRNQKVKKTEGELYSIISKMLVPENILRDFEISDVKELKENWEIELKEKPDRIPQALEGDNDIVLDGYCNPIQAMSHGFSTKPVYLKIFRRRWKQSKTQKHYSNEYDFTLKGMKLVPEMGIFLKEEDRRLSR